MTKKKIETAQMFQTKRNQSKDVSPEKKEDWGLNIKAAYERIFDVARVIWSILTSTNAILNYAFQFGPCPMIQSKCPFDHILNSDLVKNPTMTMNSTNINEVHF